jgi:hypothetical protein
VAGKGEVGRGAHLGSVSGREDGEEELDIGRKLLGLCSFVCCFLLLIHLG